MLRHQFAWPGIICSALLTKPVANEGKQHSGLPVFQALCIACLADRGYPLHSCGKASVVGGFVQPVTGMGRLALALGLDDCQKMTPEVPCAPAIYSATCNALSSSAAHSSCAVASQGHIYTCNSHSSQSAEAITYHSFSVVQQHTSTQLWHSVL